MTDPQPLVPIPEPKPKKLKKVKPKKTTATEGLVAKNNPLFPFAEEIVKFRVGPILLDIIQTAEKEGVPIQSRAELLSAYNDVAHCKLSMPTFSKWCKFLNLTLRTSFSLSVEFSKKPDYFEKIPLPPETPPTSSSAPEAFDNEQVAGLAAVPIDNSVVLSREGSGIHELAAMMAGVKPNE